jgi:hypothetical protein
MDKTAEGLLLRVVLFALIAVAGLLTGRNIQIGEPLSVAITGTFIYIVLLWEWRDNLPEFFKRCILAIPFAIIPAITGTLIGFTTRNGCILGGVTFLLLILKTRLWKRHFLISVVASIIFTFFFAIMRFQKLHPGAQNLGKLVAIFGLALIFAGLYFSYLCVVNSRDLKAAYPFTMKLLPFLGVSYVAFILVFINQIASERYHINFAVSFSISVLIAIAFWWVCKILKLNVPVPNNGQNSPKVTAYDDHCESCGKRGIPQELLFRIESGQKLCAACLAQMHTEKS